MKQKIILDIVESAHFSKAFVEWLKTELPTYQSKLNNRGVGVFNAPPTLLSDQEKVVEVMFALIHLQAFYKGRGIDDSIFYDSLYDLNYRINRYFKNNQAYGLTAKDIHWLRFIFDGEIFDLGALRFQMFHFSYAEIERQGFERMELSEHYKTMFKEGTPIVNIHIASNTNLKEDSVNHALSLANRFFKSYFPEFNYEYYVCRSWLLYPGLKQLLPETSNIIRFQNRFKIIASHDFPNQALNRIYGSDDLSVIATLEKTSTLANEAYRHLDALGVSAGIIHKNEI